jgi:hypothetical protein
MTKISAVQVEMCSYFKSDAHEALSTDFSQKSNNDEALNVQKKNHSNEAIKCFKVVK